MATFLSEEQKNLVNSILALLDKKKLEYVVKDYVKEGGAYCTISFGEYLLYIYDDGEGQINSKVGKKFYETYDYKNHEDLVQNYIKDLDSFIEKKN